MLSILFFVRSFLQGLNHGEMWKRGESRRAEPGWSINHKPAQKRKTHERTVKTNSMTSMIKRFFGFQRFFDNISNVSVISRCLWMLWTSTQPISSDSSLGFWKKCNKKFVHRWRECLLFVKCLDWRNGARGYSLQKSGMRRWESSVFCYSWATPSSSQHMLVPNVGIVFNECFEPEQRKISIQEFCGLPLTNEEHTEHTEHKRCAALEFVVWLLHTSPRPSNLRVC